MGKAIPDRWLNYQPIGQRVPSTRFIAFKVPLNEKVNNTVDEELRLAPHSLLESVPNLGLIVDLTNTNKYYNPQIFTNQNVEHQKLMIPGHHTPSQALAQRFCEYVTNFLEANADNDKLIGVHCTHGVNRTGYLICYFMITKMNMSPKLAIQTFADARGHQIERQNYTSSLLELIQLKRTRCDSDNGQHGAAQCSKRDEDQWPRHWDRQQEGQRSERTEGNWRQDPQIWQQQQLEFQQRRQKQQQPQDYKQRHQRFNQDRSYDRSQQRMQRRWQDNQRQESFNRRDNYVSYGYNQNSEGSWQSNNWRRNQNDQGYQGYSRNNNYQNDCNYSRNNSFGHNNYGRNSSYNHRLESGAPRNRIIRFPDDK